MNGLLCALLLAVPARAIPPMLFARAYSHNDYRQQRPLLDALDHGFFGVEADVHLRGRELLIGHKGGEIRPGATLQKLYLDPLLAKVRGNGGRVYSGGPKGFLLMVEFKSDGEQSYAVLRDILAGYRDMLTVFTPEAVEEKAVTVVVTGHRPKEMMRVDAVRLAGIDGDLSDIDKTDKTLFPVISDNWSRFLDWDALTPDRYRVERLMEYADKAHARGRKIRIYAEPDTPKIWGMLYDARFDYLNTDDLAGLEKFLEGKKSQ